MIIRIGKALDWLHFKVLYPVLFFAGIFAVVFYSARAISDWMGRG